MELEFQVGSAVAVEAPDEMAPAGVETPSAGTTAIDRGADLLVRVLESEQPVAVSDLASAAGLPKSTASRLLSALERRGLVTQDGERGRLRPGPAILRVAERGMLERNLVEIARPVLAALSEHTGETINLGVPGAGGVEHLLQADGRHFLGSGQWVGRTVDFHASANGKVFLAYGRALAPAGASALTAYAPATITDPAALRADIERVRRTGYAVAVDELEVGLAAVAAPVRGVSGEVVAALSVTGPTVRMTPARIGELAAVLVKESGRLSARLGYIEGGASAA
ncbi:IclR family transcriptional regulator [Conexibacter sp. S30A1]|uniref:IclR family transcriptional regulator n=1 Tax=Conexibacter sp. S30A1 TaxID=2937800 RepID=UPI00200E8401|nr:IclR family transcriptional regulator [Conexibacter sp. S30A1]